MTLIRRFGYADLYYKIRHIYWVVDEFDAATGKVRPGTPTSITFVADKAGTYEYYCSVGNHRAQGMAGKLIVE